MITLRALEISRDYPEGARDFAWVPPDSMETFQKRCFDVVKKCEDNFSEIFPDYQVLAARHAILHSDNEQVAITWTAFILQAS